MTNEIRWGATPQDWLTLDVFMGLGPDLLPCVANPAAEISPTSKVKKLGKTPTRFNGGGKVSGFVDWTTKYATPAELSAWSQVDDYAICLQTRQVRALDVDITDVDQAQAVFDFIQARVPGLPKRYRENSSKFLLAFRLAGDFRKRKFVCEGGAVEFLAGGNQFVAAGMHESGARYEWEGGLPLDFPTIDVDQFERLWRDLVAAFAVEGEERDEGVRKNEQTVDMPDDVADFIRSKGLALGDDRDGGILVACPWESEHTTGETGDGSTVYYPAGTRGYAQGHFVCLHGHCHGKRTDQEFKDAIGYFDNDFEPAPPAVIEATAQIPNFYRGPNGTSKIDPSADNVRRAIASTAVVGMSVAYDAFTDALVWSTPGRGEWVPFLDHHYFDIALCLDHIGFKTVPKDRIRDAVNHVAMEHKIDTAIEWLNGLTWDGKSRVSTFLPVYFGSVDSDYTRAVSRYLWSAMAGRVLDPGCKVDMAPILIGGQGIRKSSGIAAMVPAAEFFCEIELTKKDDDIARSLRGVLVAEIPELSGLHNRDIESVKAFMTRRYEKWVPKYREFATQFPRRCLFLGSTNDSDFLADETGNRRWLPVEVTNGRVDKIERDREQLWAEAAVMFKASGVDHTEAAALAPEVHKNHMIEDPWTDAICDWLDDVILPDGTKNRDQEFLRVAEILTDVFHIEKANQTRSMQMRCAGVLKKLGYRPNRIWRQGRPIRVFMWPEGKK